MKKKRILIFDDVEGNAQGWANKLARVPTVAKKFGRPEVVKTDEFQEAIQNLLARRKAARKGENDGHSFSTKIDHADLFLIDFDLFDLNQITYITGEEVTYLARSYSSCGVIIGINQFRKYGDKLFDLTLKGRPESYADLNLNATHISNAGLWKEPWKGFRPWYWPLLPRAVSSQQERVMDVEQNLDAPILEFLGLATYKSALSRAALEFLETPQHKPETVTFQEFVLNSPNALRRGDRQNDPKQIARIASARIHKWLERLVLPGQDVLVDAPHLVSRFSSLFKGNRMSETAWNKTAVIGRLSSEILDNEMLAPFAFSKQHWVSRPCWFWNAVSRSETIQEIKNPWELVKRKDVVFCEDISAFLPRERTHEFVADVDSVFARRFVARLSGVDYEPQNRLAM